MKKITLIQELHVSTYLCDEGRMAGFLRAVHIPVHGAFFCRVIPSVKYRLEWGQ